MEFVLDVAAAVFLLTVWASCWYAAAYITDLVIDWLIP